MIKVIYNKVCGRCVQSEPLTSGMVGQTIHFEYSHDFDGLAATAVFTDGANTVNVVNPGNECIIPHEVLTTVGAAVKVGIYAVRGDELVIPTVYATIGFVLKGADPNGGISEDPTLPVWAQTQAMIGNLNALKTQAKDNLVLAVNEVKNTTDGKQDTINDLEAIRTGAAKGATALQSVPSSYRTAAAQDVIDNGLSDRVSAIEGKEADWNGKYSKPTDGIPKTDLESSVQTSLDKAETALQSVPNTYRTASEQDTIDSGKVDKVTGKGLSTNDYTDADKAKVDAIEPVTEQTVSGWGFTKNTGTYSKPTGGIPKADLANDVQASLGKAETALQEHQSLAAYRTSADQDVIDGAKQDKLIAGENITIAADGKTISATGSGTLPKPLTYDYMPAGYPSKSGQNRTLMEEQALEFVSRGNGTYRAVSPNPLAIAEGKTYMVNWDGTEYKCVCFVSYSDPVLGNLSIMGEGEDTGEPFIYICYTDENNTDFYTLDTSATHTISVKEVETITPMAEEFIPTMNVSAFTNDAGYLTLATLPKYEGVVE